MIDVRVEVPTRWDWITPMLNEPPWLVRIDLDPPKAGPEIELTFDCHTEGVAASACRRHHLNVLATRSRS